MASKMAIIAISLLLLSGTLSSFADKLANSVNVTQGMHQKRFFHPYMQCFTMFIGESLCLIFYFATRSKNPLQLQQGKTPHQPWIFIVPAMIDCCSTTLFYLSLCFLPNSTLQMFGGMKIVWTALFSKLLLKIALEKRHFVGGGLAIMGVTVVGSSLLLENQPVGNISNEKQAYGYAMIVVSLIFGGLLFAYQQYLLTKHTINPMEMVGFQGVFGMGISLTICIILSFIPCSFGVQNCVYDDQNRPYFELPLQFVRQVFKSAELTILIITGLMVLGVYNFAGLTITKLFDALTRSLVMITKTLIVWVIGIVITLAAGENKNLQIESLTVEVNLVKATGFGLIIMGILIYSKLILQKYFDETAKDSEHKFDIMNEEITSQK